MLANATVSVEKRTYQVELAGKVGCTAVGGLVAVCLVVLEEGLLVLECVCDGLLIFDITLPSVHYRNVAQSERNNASSKNVDDVGSLVHQIDFCQHTDGPLTLRIDLARELQTVRVGQIGVGGGDSQDDGVGLADLLQDHFLNLALNIPWLISNRDSCQTGQIDERQGQDVWRVYPQVDGRRRDTCVAACLCLCLANNLVSDLVEVEELLAGNVQELSPLIGVGLSIAGLDLLRLDTIRLRGAVDQLEDERSSGDDTGASRQAVAGGGQYSTGACPTAVSGRTCAKHLQIATDNVLEHGTLSTGLRTDDDNLGQIYGVLYLRQASVSCASRGLQQGQRQAG